MGPQDCYVCLLHFNAVLRSYRAGARSGRTCLKCQHSGGGDRVITIRLRPIYGPASLKIKEMEVRLQLTVTSRELVSGLACMCVKDFSRLA